MAVIVSMDEVLETYRGREDVCHRDSAVAIAVAVAMTARGCHEEKKLASYWWHTLTVDMAVKDCHEAGSWQVAGDQL